jgi:hypothetical protein
MAKGFDERAIPPARGKQTRSADFQSAAGLQDNAPHSPRDRNAEPPNTGRLR